MPIDKNSTPITVGIMGGVGFQGKRHLPEHWRKNSRVFRLLYSIKIPISEIGRNTQKQNVSA